METLLQITISLFISYFLIRNYRARQERHARNLRMKRARERMRRIEQVEGKLKWD